MSTSEIVLRILFWGSLAAVVYTYFLAKIIGHEPFPELEKPTGPARGFLSQFLLDEPAGTKQT